VTLYEDLDGDGDGGARLPACTTDPNAVTTFGDCDDNDTAFGPSVDEVCDDLDQDCDGVVDESPSDVEPGFLDVDLDGFGSELVHVCDMPEGLVAIDGDCDDDDAAVHPDADEVCNGVDDDCDGGVDDADPEGPVSGMTTWYQDQDGDGFGAAGVEEQRCGEGAGWASNARDCDDSDSDVTDECGWRDIACYGPGGCALRSSGAVECFGDSGELSGAFDAVEGVRAASNSCGLTTDGQVVCTETDGLPGEFVAIDTSNSAVCGETTDGDMVCEGDDLTDLAGPIEVWGCGYEHCVAQRPDGSIVFWGWDQFFPDQTWPVLPTATYTQFEGGQGFMCGLTDQGETHCRGNLDTDIAGPTHSLATTYFAVFNLRPSGEYDCQPGTGCVSLPEPLSFLDGGFYCAVGISLDGTALECADAVSNQDTCVGLPE
jgi:hypothetical protein